MTKTIEQEALDLINEVFSEREYPGDSCVRRASNSYHEAICRALEQLRAEREAHAAAICLLHNNLPAIIAALKVAELVRDEDWLAERISDSLDVDWRPIDAARAIIAALPKEPDNAHD